MVNDASGFHKIYVATGYTDLRRGMEGLANIIRFRFHLDPYDRNTLFLFCHPCGWEGRAIVDNSTENLKGSSDCSGFQYCSTVIMTKGKQPPAGGNVAYLL